MTELYASSAVIKYTSVLLGRIVAKIFILAYASHDRKCIVGTVLCFSCSRRG